MSDTEASTETASKPRVFIYNEHRFDDPGSAWTNEQMRSQLATYFPEIAGGVIETADTGEFIEVRFSKRVTTKGSNGSLGSPALWDALLQVEPAERSGVDALMGQLAQVASESQPVTELANEADAHWQLIEALDAFTNYPTHLIQRCLTLSPTPSKITPIGF